MGVDLAPSAIQAATTLVPNGEFYCCDLLTMEFPKGEFDLAVSVTVMQHLPYAEQVAVVGQLSRWVRPGGYLVVLENVKDQGSHMFARDLSEWVRLISGSGMVLRAVRGFEFVPLFRLEGFLRNLAFALKGGVRPTSITSRAQFRSARRPGQLAKTIYSSVVLRALVGASFPLEIIARNTLPESFATHGAMVFTVA